MSNKKHVDLRGFVISSVIIHLGKQELVETIEKNGGSNYRS
jgi:hypothetical protein